MAGATAVEDETLTKKVAVVGAGMGGLAAALRLNHRGYDVNVFEARSGPGGLASSFELGGLRFDYGPYVLLDEPGLRWVFEELDVPLAPLDLVPIDTVYEVVLDDDRVVRFHRDRDRTASEMERTWPGSGKQYLRLVSRLERIYRDTRALQFCRKPTPWKLFRLGAARHAIFLLRGLEAVLASSSLPRDVVDAIMIWTHIAGQPTAAAPSPLALVPALIHGRGAFYPRAGMGSIGASLEAAARSRGVRFHYGARVNHLNPVHGKIEVELASERIDFDAVVSNAHGVGTYLTLVSRLAPEAAARLEALPLQPPGHCEYVRVRGGVPARSSYLRFRLTRTGECRLFIDPRCLESEPRVDAWYPARLVGPRALGAGDDTWWRESVDDVEVLARRGPEDWGREFHLFRNTMNPVMTARFMRQGRLAHKSPYVPRLYLAGSSTHPGQWVSFSAISGILAADQLPQQGA